MNKESPSHLFKTKEAINIRTDVVAFLNRAGRKIVGCLDTSVGDSAKIPVVVIPPAYGETKRDALYLSYYLVANGFSVLRYDSTDSIGESDGEILDYSMVTAKNDLLSALDFIETAYGQNRTPVIASSLALRQAIKAAREDRRISILIGLVGVVDLQSTLARIYGEDVIDKLSRGESLESEVVNTFGFEMSVEGLRSAIVGNMHTCQTTIDDLAAADIPAVFYFSENDPWVRITDLNGASLQKLEKRTISGGMHELRENPAAIKQMIRSVVVDLKKFSQGSEIKEIEIHDPDLRALIKQNKEEKEKFKITQCSRETEPGFWREYLKEYDVIKETKEYQELVDVFRENLLPFSKEDIVLDVGCGVGLLGSGLFNNVFIRKNYCYMAFDLIPEAISQAYIHNVGELIFKNIQADEIPQPFYTLCDLESENPNENSFYAVSKNSVSKVCCNLVLSYLFQPQMVLSRLFQIIKPGGKILISSLKPFADLSPVYANLIQSSKDKATLSRARKLLHSAGAIKQKEKDGYYRFFSEEELEELLLETGFTNISVRQVFSNQIFLAVAQKPIQRLLQRANSPALVSSVK